MVLAQHPRASMHDNNHHNAHAIGRNFTGRIYKRADDTECRRPDLTQMYPGLFNEIQFWSDAFGLSWAHATQTLGTTAEQLNR